MVYEIKGLWYIKLNNLEPVGPFNTRREARQANREYKLEGTYDLTRIPVLKLVNNNGDKDV